MFKILVIHGPNLNLLGERETNIYGEISLKEINEKLENLAKEKNLQIKIFQSNSEGEIVDIIQRERKWADGILINPAAYTHTSVAIRDVLIAVKLPVVEVHLSNIYKREEFRKYSFISEIANGVISGFGVNSYLFGLQALVEILKEK
jgi:3-dehydroquinate dehydratase-2